MLILGIPSLNRFDLLTKCIDSALIGWSVPDRIYVIDNSGGAYPKDWQKRYEGQVMVHQAEENLGVAHSWNLLANLAHAHHSDIILSNDDIVFAPDTIETMLAVAAQSPRAGIVSVLEGLRFCLFWLNMRAYHEVGPFDEQFYPAYFEDNDYHYRLKLAGWECPVAYTSIDHENSATMKAMDNTMQQAHHERFRANQALYLRKWGGLPGKERYTTAYGRG